MKMSNTTLGILFSAIGCGFFTMFDGTTKLLVSKYPVFEVMAFTFTIAALIVLLWAKISEGPRFKEAITLKKKHLHYLRGVTQLASNGLFAFSFLHMSLSEFYVILFLAPIIVALLSGWFLKEPPPIELNIVLLVSFAGVLIALRPADGFNIWTLVAFAGMVMNAITSMILRKMAATETALSPAYSASLVVGPCSLVLAAFDFVMPTLEDFGILLLAGLIYALGQIFFVRGFRYAAAPFAASAQFLQLPYGMLVGFILFGDVPSLWIYVGGAVVITANLFLLYTQNKKLIKQQLS